MKTFLTFLISVLLITTARVANAAVSTNSLIKLSCPSGAAVDDPCKAVYYYGSDGKRHAFPNDKVYFTWYPDFSTVQTVTSEVMASFPLGTNVTYRPGIKMVKFASLAKVYAVSKNGLLRWVASEDAARTLYGSTWNQKIDDINDAFFANYTFGVDINSSSDFKPTIETATVASIDVDKGFVAATIASDTGVTRVQFNTTAHGMIEALFRHPRLGLKLPVIIYNHNIMVENIGYEAAKAKGYDVADFVDAIADAGYVAIAPIREGTVTPDDSIQRAVDYLKTRTDVDLGGLYVIGFSRGGKLSIDFAGTTSQSVRGFAFLAPAVTTQSEYTSALNSLVASPSPTFFGLGVNEDNSSITQYVTQLVSSLKARAGEVVLDHLTYPGDHEWFYTVRPEFWNDVLVFIKSH